VFYVLIIFTNKNIVFANKNIVFANKNIVFANNTLSKYFFIISILFIFYLSFIFEFTWFLLVKYLTVLQFYLF